MRIVDQDVCPQGSGRVVVYAAGAVGDVAHDYRLRAGAELGQDIGDCGCEEEEAFGHLEGDGFYGGGGGGAADAVDGFGEFEVVVGGEEGDGCVDGGVLQDGVGDVVKSAGGAAAGCDYGIPSAQYSWQ